VPIHDFRCECGEEKKDLYFPMKSLPRYLKCGCGKRMYQQWGKGFNKKRSLTSILGSNAKHHPQLGYDIEIESPDHYKQLLKEYEMEEAGDTVKGTREWQKEELKNKEEMYKHSRPEAQIATQEQIMEAQRAGDEGLL